MQKPSQVISRVIAAAIFIFASPAMPQSDMRASDQEGLDTRGMIDSEVYQRLYYGHFDLLRVRNGFERNHFSYLFVDATTAYAKVCPHSISVNSTVVKITATTVNGYGSPISSSTRERTVDARFAEKTSEYGVAYYALGAGQQLVTLFERNKCVTPEVIQFLENLLRFAYRQPPVQDKAPEPVKRYVTVGEVERAKRTLAARTSRLDDALNMLMDLRSLDRSPATLQELYALRYKYHQEMPEVQDSFTTTVLSCSYIDPSGTTGSTPYYFWQNARPAVVSDAYLKRLSANNPLRFIGAARQSCPATEPPTAHPLDVRAKLVARRKLT